MIIQAVVIALCVSLVLADEDAASVCKIDGKTIAKGEQYDVPGHCNYHVCNGNDEWTQASCGLVGGPQGWVYIDEVTDKPYPKCCGYVLPPLEIVPDVLDVSPGMEQLEIVYEGGAKVDLGNELTPTQVKSQPSVSYKTEPEGWYLLCMTDPDAPSRKNPTRREFKHWLVGNIPGSNITAGEVLAEYVGSGPPQGTGLHRYIFLLYKQPNKLNFDEPKISKTSAEGRPLFSIKKFAQKYNLGQPIAINVYQAQYDDYVPEVHKQLGFDKKA